MELEKKLQGFQLIAQEKLQAIICSIPGKKDLIIEPNLIKPLEHICAASWLKLKGIQRIYKFDAENAIQRVTDLVHVFMIRSRLRTFQGVLQQIHQNELKQPTDIDANIKNFHIICVPSCFAYFQSQLEEEGLYGLVQLHRYNWDLIYLDQGVLSMEVPDVFPTVFLNEDTSLLPAIAHTLRVLQMVWGHPDLILSFGEHAANIVKMLNTLGPWQEKSTDKLTTDSTSDFAAMIIIDRDKDYASSLLTPAIYSGLLLEVFNNRAGEIQIESESNKILRQKLQILLPPKSKDKKDSDKPTQKTPTKPPIIHLNSLADEIYGENRYKHFAQASSLVRAQSKAIGLEVQKLSDMKLDEMHDYVARKLPKITELKSKVMRHLNASEKVIEMLAGNYRKVQSLEEDILNNVSRKRIFTEIDELLTTDGQQQNTLRLLCLLHLCAGISNDELTLFMRNYCNYFGAQHVHVFQQLANAGLLPALCEEEKLNKSTKLLNLTMPKFQQTEFQANANRLKLLVTTGGAEAAESKPAAAGACPSYVFNGLYIPVASQLCSFLLKSLNAEDIANKLGIVDKLQLHLPNGNTYSVKSYANSVKQGDVKDILPLQQRHLMVFIIGGVTYAEIGACDLVARLTDAQITVASDCILAGSDLIGSAF